MSLYNDTKLAPVNFTILNNLTFFGKEYTFYFHAFNPIGRNKRRSGYYQPRFEFPPELLLLNDSQSAVQSITNYQDTSNDSISVDWRKCFKANSIVPIDSVIVYFYDDSEGTLIRNVKNVTGGGIYQTLVTLEEMRDFVSLSKQNVTFKIQAYNKFGSSMMSSSSNSVYIPEKLPKYLRAYKQG